MDENLYGSKRNDSEPSDKVEEKLFLENCNSLATGLKTVRNWKSIC